MSNRVKLILAMVGLIAVVDLLVGTYLEGVLRRSLEESMWAELGRYASAAREILGSHVQSDDLLQADRAADRAGDATSARITVIRDDGVVIGDSEFPADFLSHLESHADRPEVIKALERGRGSSHRLSTTLREQMFYVAVATVLPDGRRLAVRAALPESRMSAAVGEMRRAVAVAGVVSLAIATLLLSVVTNLISRTLRNVVSAAQAVAGPRAKAVDESATRSISQMATDLESALAMLATERNRFEAVLQTMEQAVLALDRKGRITTVNRAAKQLLGLTREVEGRTLLEAVRVPALRELVNTAAAEEAKAAEFELSGGRRVEARATQQSDGGTVLVMLDVTEIRRLERVRRDFIANVSHELRTPISVIRANTETLLAGGLEDPVRGRQFVEAVLRHAERLGRLVSDLLDISRIEAGRYSLKRVSINVADAVDHVLDSVEMAARQRNIDLAVDIDPDVSVDADRKALEHVLINLVSNAIKYTPEGGHVEVTAVETENEVRIEVLDDGPGIDPKHRERIFERFYRVDPGRSRDMGGTGLGLSIVKHWVEAMDGMVGVESRRPQGSIFWFTLAKPCASSKELLSFEVDAAATGDTQL